MDWSRIPDHIRAMMLLAFRGLDHREQLNVWSSVNNEYDFRKISHALRIQYSTGSGKPVYRRDYLRCGRASSPPTSTASAKSFPQGRGKSHVLAVQEDDDSLGHEDAYYDEENFQDEEVYEADDVSDEDPIEALVLSKTWTSRMTRSLPTPMPRSSGEEV